MSELLYRDESYKIIGLCMEVHNFLGKGFTEIVYKDALQYELIKNNIPFFREKSYSIKYKDIVLAHDYVADFIVYEKIILEIKSVKSLSADFDKQTLNYLAASGLRLGLVINFGERSLKHKRIVL